MNPHASIMLLVADGAMLSSLQFALAVDGFDITDGAAGGTDPFAAAALVIDQTDVAGGLAALSDLRSRGCAVPAVVLVTHPTARLRADAAASGAKLVEKPLSGEDVSRTIRAMLAMQQDD